MNVKNIECATNRQSYVNYRRDEIVKLDRLKNNFLKAVKTFCNHQEIITVKYDNEVIRCNYLVLREHLHDILSFLLCESSKQIYAFDNLIFYDKGIKKLLNYDTVKKESLLFDNQGIQIVIAPSGDLIFIGRFDKIADAICFVQDIINILQKVDNNAFCYQQIEKMVYNIASLTDLNNVIYSKWQENFAHEIVIDLNQAISKVYSH